MRWDGKNDYLSEPGVALNVLSFDCQFKAFHSVDATRDISGSCKIQAPPPKCSEAWNKKYLNNPSWRLMLNLNCVHESVTSVCVLNISLYYLQVTHIVKVYWTSIYKLFLNYILFVCVWHSYVVAHVWRSEVTLWASVFSFHHGGPGGQIRSHMHGRRHIPHFTRPELFLLTWKRSWRPPWLLYCITYRWFSQLGAKTPNTSIKPPVLDFDHWQSNHLIRHCLAKLQYSW